MERERETRRRRTEAGVSARVWSQKRCEGVTRAYAHLRRRSVGESAETPREIVEKICRAETEEESDRSGDRGRSCVGMRGAPHVGATEGRGVLGESSNTEGSTFGYRKIERVIDAEDTAGLTRANRTQGKFGSVLHAPIDEWSAVHAADSLAFFCATFGRLSSPQLPASHEARWDSSFLLSLELQYVKVYIEDAGIFQCGSGRWLATSWISAHG